jgi:DNA-directed RNA polymerase subunit RPC12/RpoP
LTPTQPSEPNRKPFIKCPKCDGEVKDLGAERIIISANLLPPAGGKPRPDGDLSILYVCHECRATFYGPPLHGDP